MLNLKRLVFVFVVFMFTLGGVEAWAQEPAKDHPSVGRFPGMAMLDGKQTDFDAFEFPLNEEGKVQRVEGRSWQFQYELKQGARAPSALEVVRNYASQFTSRGGKMIYTAPDSSVSTMMMPLAGGERWLRLQTNGESIYMNIVESAPMTQKVEFSAEQMTEQVTKQGKVVLHGIRFDTAKSDIKPESAPILDQVAAMMKKGAAMKFRIDGHTDNVGNKASNLALSKTRAAAVKAALVSRGIEAARLTSDGLGDTKPVADNANEGGRSQNRRVELVKM